MTMTVIHKAPFKPLKVTIQQFKNKYFGKPGLEAGVRRRGWRQIIFYLSHTYTHNWSWIGVTKQSSGENPMEAKLSGKDNSYNWKSQQKRKKGLDRARKGGWTENHPPGAKRATVHKIKTKPDRTKVYKIKISHRGKSKRPRYVWNSALQERKETGT